MKPARTIQVYTDAAGKWRWRSVARNGRITAVSGESFDSQHNAWRAATREVDVVRELMVAVVVEQKTVNRPADTVPTPNKEISC
jgi:uncharacterized protein YegP (UPF0339 family)